MSYIKYLPDNAVLISIRAARKPYRCEAEPSPSGCHRGIHAGERYARASTTPRHDLGTGRWWSQRFCMPCAEWWGWLDALTVTERAQMRAS